MTCGHPTRPDADDTSDADLALRRRTLLARSVAAKDIHTYVLACIATFGEDEEDGGGDILTARQLGMLYRRYKILAVLTARIVRGASWTQVAARLEVEEDTARALFEETERRWRQGDPAPWVPEHDECLWIDGAAPIDITEANLPWIARQLDVYFAAHSDDPAEQQCVHTPATHRVFAVTDGLPK